MGGNETVISKKSDYWMFETFDKPKVVPKDKSKRILIVEDDPFSQKYFTKIISEKFKGYNAEIATSYEEALFLLNMYPTITSIILDIFLEGPKTGIDLFRFIKMNFPKVSVVITSAIDKDKFVELLGRQVEVPPFLRKPFRPDECSLVIEKILEESIS